MNRALLPLLLMSLHLAARAATPPAVAGNEFLGCWVSETPGLRTYMKFESTRLVSYYDGKLHISPYTLDAGKLSVTGPDARFNAQIALRGGKLSWNNDDGTILIFTKVQTVPDELKIQALPLGQTRTVPASELSRIQTELARRVLEDQAVRKDPARRADQLKVDSENTAFLLDVVKKYGWLDVERFGVDSAHAAFLLVQHSGKLPLMLAVLPEIEKDTISGRLPDGGSFALLFDRTHLYLGDRQRYGTQISRDDRGELTLPALEDPKRVDEFRKTVGLPPLAQYLSYFEAQSGKPVKILDP